MNLKVVMICFKLSVPFRYLTKKLMGNVSPNIWPLSGLRNDAVRARIFNSEGCEEVQNSGSPGSNRKREFSLLI
jgi:hypothetical protein